MPASLTLGLEATHPEVSPAPLSMLEACDEFSAGMAIGGSSFGHVFIPPSPTPDPQQTLFACSHFRLLRKDRGIAGELRFRRTGRVAELGGEQKTGTEFLLFF